MSSVAIGIVSSAIFFALVLIVWAISTALRTRIKVSSKETTVMLFSKRNDAPLLESKTGKRRYWVKKNVSVQTSANASWSDPVSVTYELAFTTKDYIRLSVIVFFQGNIRHPLLHAQLNGASWAEKIVKARISPLLSEELRKERMETLFMFPYTISKIIQRVLVEADAEDFAPESLMLGDYKVNTGHVTSTINDAKRAHMPNLQEEAPVKTPS